MARREDGEERRGEHYIMPESSRAALGGGGAVVPVPGSRRRHEDIRIFGRASSLNHHLLPLPCNHHILKRPTSMYMNSNEISCQSKRLPPSIGASISVSLAAARSMASVPEPLQLRTIACHLSPRLG